MSALGGAWSLAKGGAIVGGGLMLVGALAVPGALPVTATLAAGFNSSVSGLATATAWGASHAATLAAAAPAV